MSITVETYYEGDAGYFRIGDVSFAIPPEKITINKISNSDVVETLRNKFPMIVETGQARWEVVVRWKALLGPNPTSSDYFNQWKDVRRILAMVKAAPFVEVENEHLRAVLLPDSDGGDPDRSNRLAFALRQFTVATTNDLIDGIDCLLTMSLFNHLPYTPDFAYVSNGVLGVGADQSDSFKLYLDTWIEENLNHRPSMSQDTSAEGTAPKNWEAQSLDNLSIKWREYASHPLAPQFAPPEIKDWNVDHFTNDVTFRYLENELLLTPDNNEFALYPQGFAVAFTNNLSLIPLANYHYPTYQHVGPATSLVSISLLSTDYDAGGISEISYIQAALKEQFFKFRNMWRSVGSIQRMQAIRVENQFLNMLGIFGLEINNFTTSTIEDSASAVQCQLLCRQYENVFEMTTPFQIQGSATYYNQLLSYLQNYDFSKLNKNNQNTLSSLSDFINHMNSNDKSYLAKDLLRSDSGQVKAVRALPQIPMPVSIPASDLDAFKAVLSIPIAAGTIPFGIPINNNTTLANIYPELAQRVNSDTMSFNDFIMLGNLASNVPTIGTNQTGLISAATAAANNVEAQWSNESSTTEDQSVKQLYQIVFPSMVNGDPLLNNAVDQVTRDSDFQASIPKAQAFNGPGSDPVNIGHGSYMDLGLKSINLGVQDFNPGFYFVDHGQQVFMDTYNNVSKMLTTMRGTFGQLNTPTSGDLNPSYSSMQGVTEGDPTPIMMRASIPGYSMSCAFPTFKLFLMEENSQNLFYAFDNFYSYSSVKDIEIIRYRDKPDEAVIQITNLAGLLNHTLFDGSAEGKRESSISNLPSMPQPGSDGDVITGPEGYKTKTDALHSPGGNFQTGAGYTTDPANSTGKQNSVPLRYYSLQTGSKIQIRMGFSNNPDNLWPVFTGQVTQIEDQDGMMTIVAQSYMLELMTPVPDEMKSNGHTPIGILANIVENFDQTLSVGSLLQPTKGIHALGKTWDSVFTPISAAYDANVIFGSLSDTGSVIRDMIKTSRAKHFGHWQAQAVVDPYLKGRTWQQLLGGLVPGRVGTALSTLYDRSGDNVLINYIINQNGDSTANTGPNRSFQYETLNGDLSVPYFISKDEARLNPPWKFMKDIGRRYPEYQLSVKQYGFPYTADATLVFAHPLDYYYSRDPLLKEVEQLKFDDTISRNDFSSWWNSTGRSSLTSILNNYFNNPISTLLPKLLGLGDLTIDPTTLQITSPAAEFNRVIVPPDPFVSNINRDLSVNYFLNLLGALDELLHRYDGEFKPQVMTGSKYYQAVTAVSQLRQQLAEYLKFKQGGGKLGTPDSFARVKPVTRFHFVDHESIVHNGIKVDDKIYNTIKIHTQIISANDFIPPHHRKVLDIFDDCISPKENVADTSAYDSILASYVQSYLREELGRMYKGELILRGTPQIEPFDIVFISDASTGMSGPIEVDSVIHSFNQETGYITIVKPRALITMNESATASLLRSIAWAWGHASAVSRGFGDLWNKATGTDKTVATLTGIAAIAGVTAGALLFGGPVAIAAVVLLGLAAVTFIGWATRNLHPVFIVPLSRFERPWIGGVEGYRQGDVFAWLEDRWQQIKTDEIQPWLEAWREGNNLSIPSLSASPNPVLPPSTGPEGNGGGNARGDNSSTRLEDLDPSIRQNAINWLNNVKDAGYSYQITSTRRSYAKQLELWNNRAHNPYLVARPGTSQHELGLALDVTFGPGGLTYATSICGQYGLTWQGTRDKVHFHKA